MITDLSTPNYVIYYNVDLELLESTSSLKYDLLQDIELCSEIDTLRYELILLHRKVELLLEFSLGVQSALQNSSQLRSNLQQGIIKHVNDLILPLLEKIKMKLENKLSK